MGSRAQVNRSAPRVGTSTRGTWFALLRLLRHLPAVLPPCHHPSLCCRVVFRDALGYNPLCLKKLENDQILESKVFSALP